MRTSYGGQPYLPYSFDDSRSIDSMIQPHAYATDLAYIHDQGYGQFARDSAPGVLKILRQNGIKDGPVVDLGCGSGIWARALVDVGYRVIGVDISPAMIDLARRRVPEAEFHV